MLLYYTLNWAAKTIGPQINKNSEYSEFLFMGAHRELNPDYRDHNPTFYR